jgi:UrcA family protein
MALEPSSIDRRANVKSIIMAVAASSIAASFATTAGANPPGRDDQIVSEQVSYADLDLSSAAGQKRLKDRISFAAYGLCLVDAGASPSPAFADPRCFQRVMSDGLAQMQQAVAGMEKQQTLASATQRRR